MVFRRLVGFRVWGVAGFRELVQGLGFRVQGLGRGFGYMHLQEHDRFVYLVLRGEWSLM